MQFKYLYSIFCIFIKKRATTDYKKLMKKIIVIGSGGHARSCVDVIKSLKEYKFAGYIDNRSTNNKIIGTDRDLKKIFKKIKYAHIGVGQIKSPLKRLKIFNNLKRIGFNLPSIISPTAIISKSAKIGEGTIIMHGAILNAYAQVGKNVIINTGTIIDHDTSIHDNCHISTRAIINGECLIKKNTFIGSGSVVVNNITVGKSKFIKAHTLLKKDTL